MLSRNSLLLKAVTLILAAVVSAAVISCEPVPEEKLPELYWPLPPEKPRIKFADIIIGSIDATGVRSSGFKHLLFGEEEEFRFTKPSMIDVKNGIVYVCDIHGVHVFDLVNKKYRLMGLGMMTSPTGIAVADDNTVYVGDSGLGAVIIFGPDGNNKGSIGHGDFGNIGGLAYDSLNKRIIVCDSKKDIIRIYDPQGNSLATVGKPGLGLGELNLPYDVTVDAKGRIYVVDSGNFRIEVFEPDGKPIVAFGGIGFTPGRFSRPKGIALDSDGHIYVVDAAFGNFQIFDIRGQVYLAVGKVGFMPGQFRLPFGIAIDEKDQIYVVDQVNRRVQIFQYIKYTDE